MTHQLDLFNPFGHSSSPPPPAVEITTDDPERCTYCEGRRWVGNARGDQFPHLLRLALSGRLPMKACPECNASGDLFEETGGIAR
jgi:hypothetical protein